MKIFRKLGMRSLAAAIVLAATAAPAFADKQSEAYVEANANIVLKVLVVAFIAGGIFGYYLLDLRREEASA